MKGIRFLLETWQEYQPEDYRLIICGKGPLEEWCHEYVKTYKLQNIELRGFVKNQTVKEIIGESKAMILPTRWYEGFPMTIVESYTMGTPVIGTDLGNTGNLIEEGKSGWKFSDNSKIELHRAFENAIKEENGLDENVILKYSAEKNYEQLRKIYETCCDYH